MESYKKATKVDEKAVYAWQGIISVYEKQQIKQHTDLLDAYKRVATHFEKDDKQKYLENTLKLVNILISQQDGMKALKVLTRLAKSIDMSVEIAQLIVQILNTTKSENRSAEEDQLYTQALDVLITETPQPAEETYRRFFSQLFRNGQYEQLANRCISLQSLWNTYYSPMEWLCRLYIEFRIDEVLFTNCGGVEKVTEKLFKLHPSSKYGYFARGKYLIDSCCKYTEGFGWIGNALESGYNIHAALTLVRGKLRFGDYEGALEDAAKAVANCQDKSLAEYAMLCELLYLEGLIGANEVDRAERQRLKLEVAFSVEPDPATHNLFLDLSIRTALKKNELSLLPDLIAKIDSKGVLVGLPPSRLELYRSIKDAVNASEKFGRFIKCCIEVHNHDPSLMLQAATFLHDQEEYETAAEILTELVKTKQGSSHPHTWKYLGLLAKVEGNLPKAVKFLKKSYDLNLDSEVGAALSDVYEDIGERELKRSLLKDTLKKVTKTKSKWALARLGVLYGNEGNYGTAVDVLQSAVRVDLEDGFLWETLADAYLYRGSLSAASKAYNRAIVRGVDPTHSKMRISVIHQLCEEEDKSIAGLSELLAENPRDPFIHLELARLYCWVASEKTKENFDRGAALSVEKGLDSAVKAILYSSKPMLLPWLIIGDYSITLASLRRTTLLTVPALLLQKSNEVSESEDSMQYDKISVEKFQEIGTKSLLQGLQLFSNSEELEANIKQSSELRGYICHQIALSFYKRSEGAHDKDARQNHLLCGLHYCKKAVVKCSQNSIFWNTLGLITFHLTDIPFAQHSFIRSLQKDCNNVIAWGNLGMLYYTQGEYLLAHKAFAKGQSVAPIYANSWIGQALCAEQLDPAEAPDLFRHACLLRPHPFAIATYGNVICDILLNSEEFGKSWNKENYQYVSWHLLTRMDAVTHLYDLISRIEYRAGSSQIYNLKGIVAGWNGFYQTSLESFETALELASTESPPLSNDERLSIQSNKVSALVALKQFSEAKDELMTFPVLDITGLSNAALALYKLNDLQSAVDMYQSILDQPGMDKKKSDAKIAMAMLLNQTVGVDAAKSILFGKDMMKNPRALLTLGAIAVSQGDLQLLRAVIHELRASQWTPQLAPDIAFIQVCYEILQKSFKSAVKVILRYIHMYPTNARLYALACQVIITYNLESFNVSIPRHLALCTLKVARIVGSSREEGLFASKHSGVVSLTHLVESSVNVAIMSTLKAIRCYPEQRDNWAVLACAYWMQYSKTKNSKLLLNSINILDREIELGLCSPRIKDWISSFRLEIAKYSILSK